MKLAVQRQLVLQVIDIRFYLGPLVIGLEDVTIDITYPTPFYLAKVPYSLFVCCYGE